MLKVRVSAKAIIIDRNEVLFLAMRDDRGPYFLLPGGGQEHRESLTEAVKRECLEEIGAEVEVGELWLVRDYIAANHEFADLGLDFHQVELMFRCRLVDRDAAKLGTVPDKAQVGIQWLPLSQLACVRIYPSCLAAELVRLAAGTPATVYLGDVN